MNHDMGSIVVLDQEGFEGFHKKADVAYVRKSSLILFNQAKKKKIRELQFSQPVLGLSVMNGYFLAQLEEELRVINISTLTKLATFRTPKDSSIYAAHAEGDNITVVYPSPQKEGHVNLVKMKQRSSDDADIDDPIDINAHNSAVQCLEMSYDGSLFATCSQRGTVIRVYSSQTGKLVKELRRGTKPVNMYSIGISKDNKYLCCYSSSGTVHLFGLASDGQRGNSYSSMYMLSYVGLNYLASEWSMSEYPVLGGDGRCAFSNTSPNKVNVVTRSGKFVSLTFDLESKEAKEPEVEEKDLHSIMQPYIVEGRRKETQDLMQTIPSKLPLFVERHDKSKLPLMKKRRFLVPANIFMADFVGTIQKKLKMGPEEKLVMLVGQDTEPQPNSVVIKDVYEEKKHEDGFLYVNYATAEELSSSTSA